MSEPIEQDDVDDVDDDDDEEGPRPVGMTFRWRDRFVSLRFDDIGPGDDMVARREVGMPATAFLNHVGQDSVAVLWWMARRKMGERNLRYVQVEKVFRKLIADGGLEVGRLDDGAVGDPGADRPEGPGVASPDETTPPTS